MKENNEDILLILRIFLSICLYVMKQRVCIAIFLNAYIHSLIREIRTGKYWEQVRARHWNKTLSIHYVISSGSREWECGRKHEGKQWRYLTYGKNFCLYMYICHETRRNLVCIAIFVNAYMYSLTREIRTGKYWQNVRARHWNKRCMVKSYLFYHMFSNSCYFHGLPSLCNYHWRNKQK